MNITEFAIEKNRVTFVTIALILISSVFAYINMPRAEDPGFVVRTAQVLTYMPGASPSRVEQLVTDKLEKVIQEIPELKSVESESRTGVSIIAVNVKAKYTDMDPIWDDLRRKINRVKDELPQGVIGPLIEDDLGDVFGVVLGISSTDFNYSELKEVADQVRDELLRLEDVAKVFLHGVQQQQIFVEYNNARLSEMGLSPQQLVQTLSSRNIINPGGSVSTGEERIVLEPTGNYETLEELQQTIISAPNRRDLIYLQDIAHIYRGYVDPPTAKMTTSGAPSIGLAISMRDGGNILRLGEQVKSLVKELELGYPLGIDFTFVAFQPFEVNRTVDSFVDNLGQAVAVVTIVMLLTLGLKTGLVVASLIPATIFMSIMIMGFMNIGLDQVSLAALIIALGMLVDNAIVMVESIMVLSRQTRSVMKAAIASAKELRIPLLTSSLTTAAAFLPIYLAESETGEYTAPLFKVVSITLLSSWLLSLTLIPLLCVFFLPAKKTVDQASNTYNSNFYVTYRRFLIFLLKNRTLTIIVLISLFLGSLLLKQLVPNLFFPPSDRGQFYAEFEFPPGTAIEKTDKAIKQLEFFFKENLQVNSERTQGITNWASFIGEGPPRYYLGAISKAQSSEYAYLLINVSDYRIINDIMNDIEQFVWQDYPDLQVSMRRLDYGPPVDFPIAVRVLGRDEQTVFSIVDTIKAKLNTISGTKNVSDDWGVRTKKLVVDINQPRARRAGVTSEDIAISLQAGLSGIEMTQFREGDEIIPIVLRSVAADRHDIDKLESLNVYAQVSGESVPLKQVADVNESLVWEPAKIIRKDLLKTVTVTSGLESGFTADEINAELMPWLNENAKQWPPGFRFEVGGEAESAAEANESIMAKLPLSVLIILLLLVMQFNSIRRPVIILVTIPLGLIGVIFGLFITNSYFGFMTLLGVISLAGIVINNAIVLLDRINIEMDENQLSPQDAVIEAAQRRFRPILLTTATTIFGLVPLWFFGGAMWEPMAIAIIFGLMIATVLTLGIVPVFYSLLFRVNFKSYQYTPIEKADL